MGNIRGLRSRLCARCMELTPHRTLYVRATTDGKRRWLQLFWICTRCRSLNHIILPTYRLERAGSPLPSTLAIGTVNALKEGVLDGDELLTRLRKGPMPGISRIFSSEVSIVLEFLKGRGVVTEGSRDSTERLLGRLRARSMGLRKLAVCHAELHSKGPTRSVATIYAQKQLQDRRGVGLVPAGAFCLNCGYQKVDV